MQQSKLFTKTEKEVSKDEISVNTKLLLKAGFIDKLMAGVYTFLPLGLRVMEKIENIIRQEMNLIGGQEILMPTLHPKENWLTTGRWDSMDDLFKLKDSSDREFALGPTHEEIVVPLVEKYIKSYKDLPCYVYQIQNKFRMELRAKSGLLRGREFIMKDLYSFHLTEDDLNDYYEKAKEAYLKIFQRAGISEKTFLTFASGGSFSKYSHEFQTVSEAGEDVIYVCKKCSQAINREIFGEVKICPNCQGKDFEEKKSIEVGNIFKLMNKYSKPFDLSVKDKDGKEQAVLMGCYGIGLSRLMGTIVEVHHDENGIIWPESIAPFRSHLISLGQNEAAEKIYKELTEAGKEVLFDDREDKTAGEKFADCDLIGIPERIVVSEKTLAEKSVEIKKRNSKETKLIKINEIEKYIK
ncbi:MAG: aminoacyl--tRNA ligase-related protein [Parcubacteria group bacterium]